jgi:hypothetical protein
MHDTFLPVIILDGAGEVLEFEDLQEAEDLKNLFEQNSDSGHNYEIKKI